MDRNLFLRDLTLSLALVAVAAALTAVLIALLRPWLQRYALAMPNARSSHTLPTPQGGGIAVVIATIGVAATALMWLQPPGPSYALPFLAVVALASVGAADDIWSLRVGPRLILQACAAAMVIVALPADLQILPFVPWWMERALLGLAVLWFVNLTNFMDGIDWITVAEVVPICAAIGLLWMMDAVPAVPGFVALALGGAMLGFAPFNMPVARLFLGDVGSLPIGLLLAWLLILLAGQGHLAAALLLPLYYLSDATITLLRRAVRGEQVWKAHRSHFYQRAFDQGLTAMQIVMRIFAVNVILGILAILIVAMPGITNAWTALALGVLMVAGLLFSFARGKCGA